LRSIEAAHNRLQIPWSLASTLQTIKALQCQCTSEISDKAQSTWRTLRWKQTRPQCDNIFRKMTLTGAFVIDDELQTRVDIAILLFDPSEIVPIGFTY
jgi:hypothetical protein